MKYKTLFIFLCIAILVSSCGSKNICNSEQVENYLFDYFEIIESVLFTNYIAVDLKENPAELSRAELSIDMMSNRSDFMHLVEFPDCANEHHELTLEVIDILIDEVIEESKNNQNDVLNQKISNLNIMTEQLISKIDSQSSRDKLIELNAKALNIQERATTFFIQDVYKPTSKASDEEKKELILGMINVIVENEPNIILNSYIEYIDLEISNGAISFYVSKENISTDIQKELFKELLVDAIFASSDSNNNLIWDISKISVIFKERDDNYIEYFVADYDFESMFDSQLSQINLNDIVTIETSSDEEYLNEPSDEEKEQQIMQFIYGILEDEPENLLNTYIDFVDLNIEKGKILFFVSKGNLSTQTRIELFRELFLDALIKSTNSDNKLIWDINKIGVVFKEQSDTSGVEYYVIDDSFDEFFNNPSSLFDIYETKTYMD